MIIFVTDTDAERSSDEHAGLLDLPPSAKLVYKVPEYEGPLTQQQLCEQTRLASRTVRYAISELGDLEIVTEEIYIPDARKKLYRLANDGIERGEIREG